MADFGIEQLRRQIDELTAELEATKKYGLVWDRESVQEKMVLKCKNNIPLLMPVPSNDVLAGSLNNVLIEGDNYHALLCLNMVAKEAIDVIYIDPPYNTGKKDLNYNDHFVNADDPFYHSSWLELMSKRLKLARDLLKDSGCIFISIDDREQAQCKLLCDSIFGRQNFLCQFVRVTSGGKQDSSTFAVTHEYVICYAKRLSSFRANKIAKQDDPKKYPYVDSNGKKYKTQLLRKWGDNDRREDRPNLFYPLFYSFNTGKISTQRFEANDLKTFYPKRPNGSDGRWRWQIETMQANIDSGLVECRIIKKNVEMYEKIYFDPDELSFSPFDSVIKDSWQSGTDDLKAIFGDKTFEYAKPVEFIKHLLSMAGDKNSLIMDFFAGSGTTGQAVLEMNRTDNGSRRFILCTNNENNICTDVLLPRVRTVITGIRSDGKEYSKGIPANLHYFKTDFIRDEANSEQAKYNLVEKVDSLLCVAEDIFDEKERNGYSSHFADGDRHLFIFNDFYNEERFTEFKQRVLATDGTKIVYVYSSDNTVDETLFSDPSITLKPIPSKIYEIYREIVEEIKRGE